ncbi:diguanylate cyclase [Sphingomonas sp. PsM26]|jgi:diguanylate cyclase (GGDEF)-like protein/PAS domain S-box-containing protein|nr:diguanylate cyclase [Sphingomonas sp. PsM26]
MSLINRFELSVPLIQAPMAGVATPSLAAAVSEAGALGSIGVGATDAAGARAMIEEVRSRTTRAFNVNVFVHAGAKAHLAREAQWLDWLAPLFAECGAEPPTALRSIYKSFADGLRSARQRYRSQRSKTTTRQALAHQAQTDHLTGLGNRLALVHAFETNSHDVRSGRIALHYVDLDEFKPVNDRFGHHAGDRLLCLVGERLQACCSPGDVVVRLGGDEFVLAQLDTSDDYDVEQLRVRIENSLNAPYVLGGRSIDVGASIGSSRHASRVQTLDALLIAADTSLSQKKAQRHAARKLVAPPTAFRTNDEIDQGFAVNTTEEETRERARLLVEGIAVAIWESAPDGLIETDSLSWRTYTGQSYDDWKGYGWVTAIHPDDRIATVRKWRDTVHDQQSVEAQYRLRRWDGTYRWMQVYAVPLRNGDSSIVRWLGMNIDIDDRKLTGLWQIS